MHPYMNIMTTIGNFLIYSARSPENNPNINIHKQHETFTNIDCTMPKHAKTGKLLILFN